MDSQDYSSINRQDTDDLELSEQELAQVAGGDNTDPPEWPKDEVDDTKYVYPPAPLPISNPPPKSK